MKPVNVYSLLGTALLSATLVITGCSMPNAPATRAAAMASGSFSPGETLQVLRVINDAEIAQAELAMQSARSQEVREVAEMILRDHTRSNQRLASLLDSGHALEESPLSNGLELQTGEIREELTDLSGMDFDCTFLQKQVEQHTLALQTVRDDLRPDAEEPQIRELLDNAEPGLERHLMAARDARQSLGQCGDD